MPYFRVTYEYYVEGEYKDAAAAKAVFMENLNEATEEELSVEEFDEDEKEWVSV